MTQIDIFDSCESDIYTSYGNRLFHCSVIGANQVRNLASGAMSRPIWVQVLFEFLCFYVALTSEYGLCESSVGRKDRVVDKFAGMLLPAAVDYVFEDNDHDGNEKFKADFAKMLAARQAEYAKFQRVLPLDGDDKLKRTALGAFCAKVSETASEPNDAACMMAVHSHIHDSLKVLGMDTFAALAG